METILNSNPQSQFNSGGHSSQGNDAPLRGSTAWSSNVPVSIREIEEIFIRLKNIFGFQKDNMLNMFDHLLILLDSRSSRMVPGQALLTLHAEYIGGNYRKWYFASEIGKVDSESEQQMNNMSQKDRVRQLALWLLLWGEASQVRFMSECLCFIFKLADDYYKSQIEIQPVPEGTYLQKIITPLYRYIRDQVYEVTRSGKLVKKKKDHAETVGYEDINQLFWYRDTIRSIVLEDGQSILDIEPKIRYLKLTEVKWERVFVKKYKERRTWIHIVVNFKRIWIIHIVFFWYYTIYNAPFPEIEDRVKWSVAALGGAISTVIMFIANICELFFIQLTGSVLIRRLLFLLFLSIMFIINSSPIYYIDRKEQLSLKIGMVQFFISLITILMFTIIPSHLFYGPSKDSAFTANYAHLSKKDRFISIGFWGTIFGCKLVESYYFLSLPFKGSLEAMLKMRSVTVSTISVLAIATMSFTTFMLFLMNTFPWYVVWNIIFSAVRTFKLRKSWKNTFAMLPKNICTKILVSNEMNVNLVSQIWNGIVDAMYRDHLLSNENVKNLRYQQVSITKEIWFLLYNINTY
jgi:1,3-beta-glucan synthase